jgi:small subunit ribosomal protein S6
LFFLLLGIIILKYCIYKDAFSLLFLNKKGLRPKGGEMTMRKYELMYILKTNMEDEAKEAVVNKVKSIIDAEGKVEKVDVWGNKKLAYEIKKVKEGYYVLVNFEAAVDVPKEIERNLRITEGVLRYMIVSKEA